MTMIIAQCCNYQFSNSMNNIIRIMGAKFTKHFNAISMFSYTVWCKPYGI